MSDAAYSILDRLLDDMESSKAVPPGATGAVHAAIDQMRAEKAPAEHIALAEKISTTLLKWQWAVLREPSAVAIVREKLAEIHGELRQFDDPANAGDDDVDTDFEAHIAGDVDAASETDIAA